MELISLSRKELDRLSVVERIDRGELSQVEAALLLNCSTRKIRRWLSRYREQGLVSKRRGKPSNNRLSNTLRGELVTIIASHHQDFGPIFANEMLAERHNIHSVCRDC